MKNCIFGIPVIAAALLFAAPLRAQDSTITNSVEMTFMYIPSGSFTMGRFAPPYPVASTTAAEPHPYTSAQFALVKKEALRSAQPGFKATIKKAFYIGRYEVTQAQWQAVMGFNPSVFDTVANAGNHPVENISWTDAQAFLEKLNALETGRHYRLPTEAEWEWAARAGDTGDVPWPVIGQKAQLGLRTTAAVGGKAPNAWGLYDMLGNVWEWVQDWYNEKMFADKTPPRTGTQHVLKGASFVGDVKNATYLTHAAGPGNGWDIGLRVVLETD